MIFFENVKNNIGLSAVVYNSVIDGLSCITQHLLSVSLLHKNNYFPPLLSHIKIDIFPDHFGIKLEICKIAKYLKTAFF